MHAPLLMPLCACLCVFIIQATLKTAFYSIELQYPEAPPPPPPGPPPMCQAYCNTDITVSGVVVLWCCGVVVLWCCGVVVLLCYGVMLLWCYGVVVWRCALISSVVGGKTDHIPPRLNPRLAYENPIFVTVFSPLPALKVVVVVTIVAVLF